MIDCWLDSAGLAVNVEGPGMDGPPRVWGINDKEDLMMDDGIGLVKCEDRWMEGRE